MRSEVGQSKALRHDKGVLMWASVKQCYHLADFEASWQYIHACINAARALSTLVVLLPLLSWHFRSIGKCKARIVECACIDIDRF